MLITVSIERERKRNGGIRKTFSRSNLCSSKEYSRSRNERGWRDLFNRLNFSRIVNLKGNF